MSKRQKFTNKHQLEMMVDAMKSNHDIARGLPKCAQSDLSDFWKELSYKLNTFGPPVKDISGWKKVWVDFKWGVKKKLIRNKNYLIGAGDGRFKVIPLSRLEKEVNKIFNFEKALPAISGASSNATAVVKEVEPINNEHHVEPEVENCRIYKLPPSENLETLPLPKKQCLNSKIELSTNESSSTEEKQRLENELLKIKIYKATLKARQLEMLMGLPSIFTTEDTLKKDINEIGKNHLKFLSELSISNQRNLTDDNRHIIKSSENTQNNDAVTYLFQSYGRSFKTLPLQKQSYLKIELAKLFAKVEETENFGNVQYLNDCFEPTETSNSFDVTEVIEKIKVEDEF